MRKIINIVLLSLLLPLTGVSIIAAQDIFDKISADAIHEDEKDTYHSSFLLLHAENTIGVENEDAVVLFERLETRWTADGRLIQTTKRSVLIRTEYGIDHYADLRIPWDSARQKLTVHSLRTARLSDEEWIDAGPTAVVETLPFAVDRAPDYCHLRQTMLLHDGVELPCVLETSWTIEDTEPFRPGAGGTHSLALPEPAVVSQFVLVMPPGMPPVIESAGGAPQPTESTNVDGGKTWSVMMSDLAPRPHPVTDESIGQQPRVSWSTWKDWAALGSELTARVDRNATLDDALQAAFEEELEAARTPAERARLTAEFVDRTTRLIDFEGGWWPDPRPASRTWATGYGHRVDRAILAAALFRKAGFTAEPAFRSEGYGDADPGVPQLRWSEGVSLLVGGCGVYGWFDPESSRLDASATALLGRTFWFTREVDSLIYREPDAPDHMTVRFDLGFNQEKQAWTGTGLVVSEGAYSLFNQMRGLGSEAQKGLNGFAASILSGAVVSGWSPERFDVSGVTAGFSLELPAGDRDTQGRLAVELAAFPADHHVTLHQENRDSDIHLPAPVEVQYEIHLRPGDLETVHLPHAVKLENHAGRWMVESSQDEDEVVLIRRLELPLGHYPAAQWPDLRALLLAANHRAGRRLYFK